MHLDRGPLPNPIEIADERARQACHSRSPKNPESPPSPSLSPLPLRHVSALFEPLRFASNAFCVRKARRSSPRVHVFPSISMLDARDKGHTRVVPIRGHPIRYLPCARAALLP